MRVVVGGSTGFIGKRLVQALASRGDEVVALTRSTSGRGARALASIPGVRVERWSGAAARESWWDLVDGAGAVVNLAGEPVMGRRWDPAHKARVMDSRVEGGRAFVRAIEAAAVKPRVFVSASAVGFYGGHRGDDTLREEDTPGHDFLAGVCRRWEEEASKAPVRTVLARIGIVLGDDGGALEQMLPAFKAFAGGPIASGRQWMPWVHVDDVVAMLLWSIDDDRVSGPLNVVSPEPVRNADFSRALGTALRRPSWLPVPAFGLRVLFGEAADVLVTGQRVLPAKATALGYAFRRPALGPALSATLDAART